jgi:protein-S-isoprenylcysteine O-methyltransferase Ste14
MDKAGLIKAIYRWRVRAALFFLLAVLALARPTWVSIGIGVAVCAIGLFIRAWASGHIKKEKELAVSGPYQYTRNPLYVGNFVLGLSIALGACSWWCAGVYALYFLVFYPPVILEERNRMRRLFPKEYEDYKKKVPLFFPTLKPSTAAAVGDWSWSLYKKNREHRALIGSLIIWAVLIAKMLLI